MSPKHSAGGKAYTSSIAWSVRLRAARLASVEPDPRGHTIAFEMPGQLELTHRAHQDEGLARRQEDRPARRAKDGLRFPQSGFRIRR